MRKESLERHGRDVKFRRACNWLEEMSANPEAKYHRWCWRNAHTKRIKTVSLFNDRCWSNTKYLHKPLPTSAGQMTNEIHLCIMQCSLNKFSPAVENIMMTRLLLLSYINHLLGMKINYNYYSVTNVYMYNTI